jgi:hypothetical protein
MRNVIFVALILCSGVALGADLTRYQAGVKVTKEFVESKKKPYNLTSLCDMEDKFLEALKENGKDGIAGLESVVFKLVQKDAHANYGIWTMYVAYLTGPAADWGYDHINNVLKSDKLQSETKMDIILKTAQLRTYPSIWMDKKSVLTVLSSLLKNTSIYGPRWVSSATGKSGKPIESKDILRICDYYAEFLSGMYNIDIKSEATRDEYVSTVQKWVATQFENIDARERLLKQMSDYRTLKLSDKQFAALLDSWMSMGGQPDNFGDMKVLVNLLQADLKMTEDAGKGRSDIENFVQSALHSRILQWLEFAGYKVEEKDRKPQQTRLNERGWLRGASMFLSQNATEYLMRRFWQHYADELAKP